jgi:hypothetical protein
MALPHNWIWFQFSLGEQEIMIFIYYLLSTRTDPWAFFPLVRWNASLLFSLSRFTPSFFRIHQKQRSIWSRLQGNFFYKNNLIQTSSWKLQICVVVWLSQNVNLSTWASQCCTLQVMINWKKKMNWFCGN